MVNMTGGCLCGKVRYTISADPVFAGICHCRNCQRYTGSAFETVFGVPEAALKIEGELKTYDDKGDSGGTVHRRFCPNCGSGIVADVTVMPGIRIVLTGGLDDPSQFKPVMEIFCDSAQPWTMSTEPRQRIPRMPG